MSQEEQPSHDAMQSPEERERRIVVGHRQEIARDQVHPKIQRAYTSEIHAVDVAGGSSETEGRSD